MKHKLLIRPSAAVLVVALSSMALYACGQNNGQSATSNTTADASGAAAPALPLTTGAETAPVYAPAASALPAAARPKIVRVASQADQYAYVDQASSMGSALGHAPPDYGFDYDGVHPWVWRTHNNAARLVEPTSGGYRYYFYQPGASQPYLIRDPQYSYGFNNGELVVVYDARGNILPPQYMDQQADYAGRYLARARALYQASLNSQRRAVIAANWAARSAQIDEQQAEWDQQQSQYSAWQEYHQQHEAEQQAYWQGEHDQRAASAQQFNQWHDNGYQGPPPPPAYGAIAGAAGAALVAAPSADTSAVGIITTTATRPRMAARDIRSRTAAPKMAVATNPASGTAVVRTALSTIRGAATSTSVKAAALRAIRPQL